MFSSWEDIAAKVRAKVDADNRWDEGELYELHQLQVLTEEVGELNAAHREHCDRARPSGEDTDDKMEDEMADVAISLIVFAELYYGVDGYRRLEELVSAKLGRINDRGGL